MSEKQISFIFGCPLIAAVGICLNGVEAVILFFILGGVTEYAE